MTFDMVKDLLTFIENNVLNIVHFLPLFFNMVAQLL
jgi:hypothetical protein